MKTTTILLCFIFLFSCKKDVTTSPTPEPKPTDCSKEFGELYFRPVPALQATVLSTTSVRLSWKKRGREEYFILRDGVQISSCQCNTFTDTGLSPNTTYTYTVNGLSATVTTFQEPVTPTGNNVLLLDFDGHLVTGTAWNSSGDFYATPSGMSAEDIAISTAGIASAFAPFNVAVTTDETVYNNTPPSRRQREIITEYYQWFGSAGGVAFVNSFGSAIGQTDQPCFVFSSLLNYNTNNVIFAGGHELGHTLGLYHAVDFCGQNYSTGPFYMGGNYQYTVHEWRSSGLNNLCENVNEFEVINSKL